MCACCHDQVHKTFDLNNCEDLLVEAVTQINCCNRLTNQTTNCSRGTCSTSQGVDWTKPPVAHNMKPGKPSLRIQLLHMERLKLYTKKTQVLCQCLKQVKIPAGAEGLAASGGSEPAAGSGTEAAEEPSSPRRP